MRVIDEINNPAINTNAVFINSVFIISSPEKTIIN